jgi:proteasome lid subunit RPN8/RPN11
MTETLPDYLDHIYKAVIFEGKLHAPMEACGFIVQTKDSQEIQVIPCANQAGEEGNQMFILDSTTFAEIEETYDILAIYHTHPTTAATPSDADIKGCRKSNHPWLICNPFEETFYYFLPSTEMPKRPLLGREFSWGTYDCYSLLKEFYETEIKIELPEFDRGLLFEWETNESWNKFEEGFGTAGFETLSSGVPLQKGDVFLMNIGSRKINHCAVLVYPDKNIFYHHLYGRKSEEAIYGGWFSQVTRKVLRHSTNL